MTREEIYSTIYTHEEIYRPPKEEGCACLEVALGCSWGKCLFCDFAKDKFQIHPMAKIEWNLRMLGRLEPDKTRVRAVVSMFGRETPVDLELDQVEVIKH